ncbi:hypothetical protein DPEC_G00254270 [Dallia pectoralis]|uniref:Uncharacterized protein n=1 Tax=Dallia pectoralis TaxID=75939 RepID=A0ACC2FTX1_DALPE|nr:hypothetical protein DPEC_G00254270 [Dallia pectoralis]
MFNSKGDKVKEPAAALELHVLLHNWRWWSVQSQTRSRNLQYVLHIENHQPVICQDACRPENMHIREYRIPRDGVKFPA